MLGQIQIELRQHDDETLMHWIKGRAKKQQGNLATAFCFNLGEWDVCFASSFCARWTHLSSEREVP